MAKGNVGGAGPGPGVQDDAGVAKALIDHLSREIEVQGNAIVAWRSRLNFTAFFGPWLAFGGYFGLLKKAPAWPGWTAELIWGGGIFALCYLLTGLCAGVAERSFKLQCDRWRIAIKQVTLKGPRVVSRIKFKHPLWIRSMYVAVYVLMLCSFVSGGVLLTALSS